MCSGGVRKAKGRQKLELVRGTKGNRKNFCRYTSRKRKDNKNISPWLSGAGDTGTC